jgi:hypothetical protein
MPRATGFIGIRPNSSGSPAGIDRNKPSNNALMTRPSGLPVACAGSIVLISAPLLNTKSARGKVPMLTAQTTAPNKPSNINSGKNLRTNLDTNPLMCLNEHLSIGTE